MTKLVGDDYIDFLRRSGALRLGESPWPDYYGDETWDQYPIDWRALYPTRSPTDRGQFPWEVYGDEWELPDGPLIDDLQDRDPLGRGGEGLEPPGPDEGWDTCAWYQPMHYYGHDWGIFIRQDCLEREAWRIAHFVPPAPGFANPGSLGKALLRAAVYQLFLHEQFHHRVESLAIRLQLVEQRDFYVPYMKRVYRPTLGTDRNLEEAMANANARRRLGENPYRKWITPVIVGATRNYLDWRFPHDPPGYRRAHDHVPQPGWDSGQGLLGTQVHEATETPLQAPDEFNLATHMTHSLYGVDSPIWLLVPAGTRPRLPVTPPVRTCSTSDLERLLRRHGYDHAKGGKGSHIKLKKPGAPMVILPANRKDLSPGAAKSALAAIGRRLNELPDLLS